MENITDSFVESTVQCWTCPVFDTMIQMISNTAAAVYDGFVIFSFSLFAIMFSFYIVTIVWKNLRSETPDPLYVKYLKPVLINSLIVFALLGMGVVFPRMVTSITIEPAAKMATVYTHAIIQTNQTELDEQIEYTPAPMNEDGFFTPDLRDTIISMVKTTITQFQGYIKLGIAVMDSAFTWEALLGIGEFFKHLVIFFMGLFLAYNFFKLFMRFCFYFMDIIISMTMFAFFFPLSLVSFIFKNTEAPDWVKNVGKDLGVGQIKSLISSIITLAVTVLSYTIIMVIIAKFFSSQEISTTELMNMIMSGEIYAKSLGDDNLAAITVMGTIVLLFLINYITSLIPEITKSIMDSLNVEEKNTDSEKVADAAFNMTKSAYNTIKTTIKEATKKP